MPNALPDPSAKLYLPVADPVLNEVVRLLPDIAPFIDTLLASTSKTLTRFVLFVPAPITNNALLFGLLYLPTIAWYGVLLNEIRPSPPNATELLLYMAL